MCDSYCSTLRGPTAGTQQGGTLAHVSSLSKVQAALGMLRRGLGASVGSSSVKTLAHNTLQGASHP